MKRLIFACIALISCGALFSQVDTKYTRNVHTGRMDAIPYWQIDSVYIDVEDMTESADTLIFAMVHSGRFGYAVEYTVKYTTIDADDCTVDIQENTVYSDYSTMNSSLFPFTLEEREEPYTAREIVFYSPAIKPYQIVIFNKGSATEGVFVVVRSIKVI